MSTKKYDVIIVGGGAAGLSAAITLGSAQEKFEWAASKRILLIDSGKSDLRAAKLNNAPGISVGISGSNLLNSLFEQLAQFKSVEVIEGEVTTLEHKEQFILTTSSATYQSEVVLLATGMQKVNIESKLFAVEPHTAIAREGKVCYRNSDGEIVPNLYAVGLAKGLQTMYAIAAGDGADRASKILWQWSGKPAVPHDVVGD